MECFYPIWRDGSKAGKITQQFGEYNPRYDQWGFTHHNGIDIAEQTGLAVHGMSGVVDVIGDDRDGYGLYVSIKDEVQQCWWTYAHLSHISVKHGQHLLTGDIIGRVGSTGNSSGPHVHVECKPFDYKAYKENGTLGRVDFNWFITIVEDEDVINYEQMQEATLNALAKAKGAEVRAAWIKANPGQNVADGFCRRYFFHQQDGAIYFDDGKGRTWIDVMPTFWTMGGVDGVWTEV